MYVPVSDNLDDAYTATVALTTRCSKHIRIISGREVSIARRRSILSTVGLHRRKGDTTRVGRVLRGRGLRTDVCVAISALGCLGGNKEVAPTTTTVKAILGLGPILRVRKRGLSTFSGTEN